MGEGARLLVEFVPPSSPPWCMCAGQCLCVGYRIPTEADLVAHLATLSVFERIAVMRAMQLAFPDDAKQV